MVFDDKLYAHRFLKAVLKQEKYKIITVTNNIKYLNEIEKGSKGIIFLDIMIPQMEGKQSKK